MYWLCEPVSLFWNRVSGYISKILGRTIPCTPQVLLLNDVSGLQFSIGEKCVFLSGITAAKKLLALRWKPPHDLSEKHWVNMWMEILQMELSVARVHGAGARVLGRWSRTIDKLKETGLSGPPPV